VCRAPRRSRHEGTTECDGGVLPVTASRAAPAPYEGFTKASPWGGWRDGPCNCQSERIQQPSIGPAHARTPWVVRHKDRSFARGSPRGPMTNRNFDDCRSRVLIQTDRHACNSQERLKIERPADWPSSTGPSKRVWTYEGMDHRTGACIPPPPGLLRAATRPWPSSRLDERGAPRTGADMPNGRESRRWPTSR